MATFASITKTVIILDKPEDWDEWFFLVKNKTQDVDVYKHIDVDLVAKSPLLYKPLKSVLRNVKIVIIFIITFTIEEKKIFKYLRNEYKSKLFKYK